MSGGIERVVGQGGRVTISDPRCTFVYDRLRPGVLEIRISGIALTMAIAQHLSNTGKLMQTYSDRELYESRK